MSYQINIGIAGDEDRFFNYVERIRFTPSEELPVMVPGCRALRGKVIHWYYCSCCSFRGIRIRLDAEALDAEVVRRIRKAGYLERSGAP